MFIPSRTIVTLRREDEEEEGAAALAGADGSVKRVGGGEGIGGRGGGLA